MPHTDSHAEPAIALPWDHRPSVYAPDDDTPIKVRPGPLEVGDCELCSGLGFVFVGVADEFARALCACTTIDTGAVVDVPLGEPVGASLGEKMSAPEAPPPDPKFTVAWGHPAALAGRAAVLFRSAGVDLWLDAALALELALAFAEAAACVDADNGEDHAARCDAVVASLRERSEAAMHKAQRLQ